MAVKLLKCFFRSSPTIALRGISALVTQTIRLEPAVLEYVYKHRQLNSSSTEAGGQLFGIVSADEIRVVLATGPYRGDERGRYDYRSNPMAAQKAVERQAKAGLLYLGEWHTHAEDRPSASGSDMDAMRRLLVRSKLNVNALLMLIVGRSSELNGLDLRSVSTSKVDLWILVRDD
jgi:integrative and conjugative element protein (TIGR02256 family)